MPKSSIKPTEPRSSKIKTDRKTAPSKRATRLRSAVAAERATRLKPAVAAKAVRTPMKQATPSKQVAPALEPAASKQAVVLGMLREATGASVASIMTATGWQQHSVRGFFAGVVRKKLKLNLTSEPSESGRIYKITDEGVVVAAGAVASTRPAA